jgi:hypothetical protein
MKRKLSLPIITLVVGILLLLPVIGCSSGSSVNAENVATRAAEAMLNLKTYQLAMDMSLNMAGTISGEAGDINLSANAEGNLDLNAKALAMDVTMSVTGTGGEENIDESLKTSSYIVDNTMYTGYSDGTGAMTWQSQEAPTSMWDQQDQMAQKMKIMQSAQIKYLKSEKVDGLSCYVVELEPDVNTLWETIMAQLSSGEQGLGTLDLQNAVKSMTVKYWFTRDNLFLKKAYVIMVVQMTGEQFGGTAEETMDLTLDVTVTFDKFNQTVAITVPAEATVGQ